MAQLKDCLLLLLNCINYKDEVIDFMLNSDLHKFISEISALHHQIYLG